MKQIKIIFISLIAVVLSANLVMGVSIGLSPGRVAFTNMIQDGYAERDVRITTNSEEPVFGHFTVRGEMAEWIRFNQNSTNFSTSRNAPFTLTIISQPPGDIPNGNYSGSIEFVTDGVGSLDGRAGGVIKAAVTLLMNGEVSGTQTIDCRAGGFFVDDTELNSPLIFGSTVINDGNVRLTPTLSLTIWDQLQERIVVTEEVVGTMVLPTTENRMQLSTSTNLQEGQYWVDIDVPACNTNELLTFSVVERGGLIDKGDLTGLYVKPWAVVGETVEFLATFSNSGQRAVTAQFKGTMRRDGTIVDVIETDEVIVGIGESTEFPILFTPTTQGRYELTGRVSYNKKLSFERTSILNVREGEAETENPINFLPLIIYLVIIISILFVVRKIMKGKRRKRIF